MDAWITIIAIGAVIWWISSNKTKSISKTKVIETSEYKTQTGKIYVEKTYEYEDSDLSIKNRPKYTPAPPRNYTPIQQPITINQEKPAVSKGSEYHDKLKSEYADLKNRVEKILPDKSSKQSLSMDSKEKECPNCQKLLPHSSFGKSGKNDDGLTKWCSDCLSRPRDYIPAHLKVCPKCRQRRLKSNFAKNSNTSDGLAKWCKYCMIGIKR